MTRTDYMIGNLIHGHYEKYNDTTNEYEDVTAVVKIVGYDPFEQQTWLEGPKGSDIESYNNLEPIPLTVELCKEKLFAETYYPPDNDEFFYIDYSSDLDIALVFRKNGKVVFIYLEEEIREIMYLHELQNIYYWLTGKQLDVSKVFV